MSTNLQIGSQAVSCLPFYDYFVFNCFLFSVTKDVDIGELASLTETNNVIDCNTTLSTEVRKTWSQKYILKYVYIVLF